MGQVSIHTFEVWPQARSGTGPAQGSARRAEGQASGRGSAWALCAPWSLDAAGGRGTGGDILTGSHFLSAAPRPILPSPGR